MKINYGRLLEQHCQKTSLSYDEVAEQLGVSVRTIFRWISGENYPKYKQREKLNTVLGITKPEPKNVDSEVFVITPINPRRRMSVVISEDYYDMLREMSLISDCKITHACEQAIQFAYDRFGGDVNG
jgi:excisionase family DNA binding protein